MNAQPRKTNPLVRLVLGVVLLGVMIYTVGRQVNRGRPAPEPSAARSLPSAPLPKGSPSADSASRFAWVPRYPGAEIVNIRTQRNREHNVYAFEFEVPGGFEPVLAFYETALRTAGFLVTRKSGSDFGGVLYAQDSRGARTVEVTAGRSKDTSQINVTATEDSGG